ncbi:peptidoglycan-binding domain-containing protein [Sorangium sp. So ce834]|uniref:peptidoglycan-binding domain-containing protein n=1 Tax=Sorangium sp. So ce834 TaxID=3133321 RepID=UPI003F5DEF4C
MRPYVIRQGDYLAQLAHRYSFSAAEVWNHPLNDALRQKRASPDILQPGDILYLPDARDGWNPLLLTTGGANRFTARIPSVEIKLVLERADTTPIANKRFRVEGLGTEPFNGITDASGLALFPVPVHVREVNLALEEEGLHCQVCIGQMDPVDEPSGAAKRLTHLGYPASISLCEFDVSADVLSEAIAAFQTAHGQLEITGTLDDATRDALVQAHGS